MKALRQKVAERNPDEFAFGMMSSTSKGGILQTKRGEENGTTGPLSLDVARLLKTQDAGYLQTVLQQTRRERERVEMEAVQAGAGVSAGTEGHGLAARKVFDDEGNEVNIKQMGEENSEDDSEDGLSGMEDARMSREDIKIRRRQRRGQGALGRKLETLVAREKDLSRAVEQLQQQRSKMHGTTGGVNKKGTTFKVRERKR